LNEFSARTASVASRVDERTVTSQLPIVTGVPAGRGSSLVPGSTGGRVVGGAAAVVGVGAVPVGAWVVVEALIDPPPDPLPLAPAAAVVSGTAAGPSPWAHALATMASMIIEMARRRMCAPPRAVGGA